MKFTTRGRIVGAGAAIAAAVAAVPTTALAESVGADILIPKPAETIPMLVAFLIIVIILGKFAWPQIVKMMEKRQAKIQADLDAAEKSRIEAAEYAKTAEASIDAAHLEAEEIVAQAKKEAEGERAAILAKAQKESAELIAKSRGAIESERHKAMVELSSSVVDLAVEIAAKIIGDGLSEDQQRTLAEKYLAEVSAPNGD